MFKDTVVLDAEAEDLGLIETINAVVKLDPGLVIIIPTGNHPSAQIQQADMARIVRQCLLANRIKCEIWNTLPENPIELGSPDWTGVNLMRYRGHTWHCNQLEPYGVLYTAISCPFKCKFCMVSSWYRSGYARRPVEQVINDLLFLKENKIKNIKIMDEVFLVKKQVPLLEEMAKIHYRFNMWCYARLDCMAGLDLAYDAGIKWAAVGIESGNSDIRAKYGKGKMSNRKIKEKVREIKDARLKVIGNFIFGFPEDTMDTMQETLDFAKELKLDAYNVYTMMAYPNTELWTLAKEKGWELPKTSVEFSQYSPRCKPLRTHTLTSKQVLEFRDNAFKELHPGEQYERMVREV
jgi:radical SAM superfamily enzyme YgiQ (UPF0313 family)